MSEETIGVVPGTHDRLSGFLAHCERAKKVPMIWGAPGIGKTEVVHAYGMTKARELGREFKVWHSLSADEKTDLFINPEARKRTYLVYDNRAASNDSTDDKGIPNISNGEYLEWLPNRAYIIFTMPEIVGMLFNDEITLAPTLVQNSMYKMVHDRAVGDISFNENIFVVCAGNREVDQAFVQKMPLPLRTRMVHFWLVSATKQDQIDHFLKIGIDTRLIGFFSAHENLIFTNKTAGTDEFTACVPRTIVFCSDLIAPLVYPLHKEDMRLLACGAMSTFVGTMFMKFLQNTASINLDEYLQNPAMAGELTDLEQMFGLVTLAVHRFGLSGPEGDIIDGVFGITKHLQKEVGILLMRMLKDKSRTKFMEGALQSPEINAYVREMAPIIVG